MENQVILFILSVIVWVGVWGIVSELVYGYSMIFGSYMNPILFRTFIYILLIIMGLFILFITNHFGILVSE